MAKIPEAEARTFRNIFVCRKCKHKMRASSLKVAQGKVKCRNCNSSALRPLRKKG
ncbi:50S ribosomal protein L40e [Candidatus Woesearchaeota archaeon]|nr:50S ribosomal protein L40e [Candidatus Woesearchaeota archaeon]